jgi:hypothetical protein
MTILLYSPKHLIHVALYRKSANLKLSQAETRTDERCYLLATSVNQNGNSQTVTHITKSVRY